MTTEVRTRKIPAQIIPETWYIARDGKEFRNEQQCIEWEHWLDLQEHHVFKTCITDNITLDEEIAVLYHLRDESDHALLVSTLTPRQQTYLTDDYCLHGPGWYIYFNVDGGDGPDFPYLCNYEKYVRDRYEELDIWKASMDKQISNITR